MRKPTCLGLHIGHDRAISIAQGNRITFHLGVERLDRTKHSESHKLPAEAIRQTLRRISLPVSTLDAVCITYHQVDAPRVTAILEAEFREDFKDFSGTFSVIDHHLAHALGAFSCSPFEQSLVLVADGAGDIRPWGTQSESLFHVSRSEFYLLEERLQGRPLTLINRPEFYIPEFFDPADLNRQISIGLKYEQITYLCGFAPGQAGQTMALAAFGVPLFDLSYLVPRNFGFSLRYVDLLDGLGEIARQHQMTLLQFARRSRDDIAATAQKYLEMSLVALVDYIVEAYEPEALCFSGGVFLNCPVNRKILDRHSGIRQFTMPVCNDEGQSIGAAAYATWQITSSLPQVDSAFPYLGLSYSLDECRQSLCQAGLKYEEYEDDDQLAFELARLLAAGKICAVLRGRSESGPRALGNRSILGDPRFRDTKTRLDNGIKRRAAFRPYAPIVLESRAQRYFDITANSPYMLLTASVKQEYRDALLSVTHVDGTARVQTITPDAQPFLAKLLACCEESTGLAVLLNTSFNDQAEPMVESPADAIRTFLSTDLDVLLVGSLLHIKQG